MAKRAGVSTATVSRVLNNKMAMPIPAGTIDRIRGAAHDLQYRPNAQARALITRRTYTLGLYTREMGDPHFAQMLQAVEASARALGYHIAICGELDALLRQGRVDGVLLLADPTEAGIAESLDGLPATFVWQSESPVAHSVAWSDTAGARLSVDYLLDLGHRAIAGLFGDLDGDLARYSKVAGYRGALQDRGLAPVEWTGKLSADQFENGYLLTQRAVQSGAQFTALFARNDFLAVGAIAALREGGISVPGQISIVGYNDTILAHCAGLTSVRTPIAEAGAEAVQRLIRIVEGEHTAPDGVLLETELTIRSSCAPRHAYRNILS